MYHEYSDIIATTVCLSFEVSTLYDKSVFNFSFVVYSILVLLLKLKPTIICDM